MALYRETATGFLVDYASAPGAGYTAITSLPTTTTQAKADWWRVLDTFGQTSAWHPSASGTTQDAGSELLALLLTKDSALIASDANGNVTDGFLTAQTLVKVMRGTQDATLTDGWTFSKTDANCTSTLTLVNGVWTVQLTAATASSGYVRITATRTGSTTLTKDFTWAKAVRGIDGVIGSSGIVIDLSNESHAVPTAFDGSGGNFTGCATTATIYLGAADDSANWTFAAPTVTGGITGTVSNSNRTYTVAGMTADTGTVTFTATRSGYATQTAVFTVTKAKGGADGTPATVYRLAVSHAVVQKSAAGLYNPTVLNFAAWKRIGNGSEAAYSGRFSISTQATAGGAWTTLPVIDGYTSTDYTVPAGVVAVRCQLWLAGTTTVLDQETIPVVTDGTSGIMLDLDNEAHTIATDSTGANGDYTGCTSTATVYMGGVNDSASWTFSWSPASSSSGITYALSNSNRTVTVSNFLPAATKVGALTCTATKGSTTVTTVFTITKAFAGTNGAPATVYRLALSHSAIQKSAAGAYNPTTLTLNGYSKTGTAAETAYSGRFVIATQATAGGAWTTQYTSASNQSTYTYTIPVSIVAVRCQLTEAGGTGVVFDQETVPIVSDGATGSPGNPGAAGIRGSVTVVLSGTSWIDSVAWNGVVSKTGTTPVPADIVTIADAASGFAQTRFYTGPVTGVTSPGTGYWQTATAYINGNLLVNGTVGASQIAAGAITAGSAIIADGAITSAKIANATITDANVANLSASKLTAGTINADVITVTNLEADNIKVGGVMTGNLAANAATVVESYFTTATTNVTIPSSWPAVGYVESADLITLACEAVPSGTRRIVQFQCSLYHADANPGWVQIWLNRVGDAVSDGYNVDPGGRLCLFDAYSTQQSLTKITASWRVSSTASADTYRVFMWFRNSTNTNMQWNTTAAPKITDKNLIIFTSKR